MIYIAFDKNDNDLHLKFYLQVVVYKMPESNNKAKVVLKPFYDPKKNITTKSL